MFDILKYILIILAFTSCKSKTNSFNHSRLLTTDEMYEILDASLKSESLEIVNLDCKKRPITQSEINAIGKEEIKSEYHLGENGKIFKLNCKGKPSLSERILEALVLFHNVGIIPERNLDAIDIEFNCEELQDVYDELIKQDQFIRTDLNFSNPDAANLDKLNLLKFIKIITECGIQENHVEQLWILNQHAPIDIQMKNYLTLKKYHNQGQLTNQKMALSQDRILVMWGFKQEYGSQVGAPIHDKENVNERRAKMGMESIEDYLKRF